MIILSNFILFEGIFIQQINKRSVSTSMKIVGASRKVREDYAKKATIDDADSSVQSANFVSADFLISGHPANPRLMEAALSLVHGHQVNIDIAHEFSMTTYSRLNIQTVTPILPPILKTVYKNVSLCHNFLSQVNRR